MKHCTIIYDGPPLKGLFRPASAGAQIGFAADCIDRMMDEVERVARNHGYEDDILDWGRSGQNPLRISVVCQDRLAGILRMRIADDLLVELDDPKPR